MRNQKNQKNSSANSLEQEIENIYKVLVATAAEGSVVRKEKVERGKMAKGYISIFQKIDLKREQEEAEAYAEAKRNGDPLAGKPFVARPKLKYAFYPSTYDDRKIGSVAIYGEEATQHYWQLRKRDILFSHRIRNISLEMGLRPFVNVTL